MNEISRTAVARWRGAATAGLLMLVLAGCGGAIMPTATPLPASIVRVPQNTPAFPVRADVFSNATPSAAVFVEPTPVSAAPRAAETPPALSRTLLRAAVSSQTPSAVGIAPGGGVIYDAPAGRVVGSIPTAGVVTITGRSADGNWYAVYDEAATYGWTPASQLRVYGGDDLIVVATAPDPGPVATLLAESREPVTVLDALMVEMATRTAPNGAEPGSAVSDQGTPTPAPTLAVDESAVNVSDARLNLRAAPSTSAAIVAKLAPGAVVTVQARDESGNWLQVDTAEGTGWVAAEFLRAAAE